MAEIKDSSPSASAEENQADLEEASPSENADSAQETNEEQKAEGTEAEAEAAKEERVIPESFFDRLRPDKHELLARTFLLCSCSGGEVESACRQLDTIATKSHTGITGLCIVQKDLAACILEGASETLSDAIDSLHALQRKGNAFAHVHVLNHIEGFPSRSFWSYSRAEVTPSKGSGVSLSEVELSEFVFELYSNFLSIGSRVRKSREMSNMENLKQNFPDLIPPYERLQVLVGAQHILTLEEFVDLFHKPFAIPQLEDRTWPIHVVNDDLGGLLSV